MSIRTTYRRCLRCGKSIPFNPSVGKFSIYCPRCLTSLRTVSGDRPFILLAPRRKP